MLSCSESGSLLRYKSVFVCVLLIAFAAVTSRARKMEGIRAQKVVLASATFDHDGRLMVLPDGTLPIKEVTDSFQEKVFGPKGTR